MSDLNRLGRALADRYRVERELGAGGMATVYLAHDLRHERDVAIKVLHPDLGAALGGERFLAEIKTTARLQHPHILPLLDSGAADGLLYYVMPYVRGETLRSRLEREKQLPVDDAVRLAREVAEALHTAHAVGVVHRDIKPENILLQDGHALVADFGIALAVQQAGGQRMTQTGLSLGTPQYMSPEQAMGERTVDARSDIYALGAVTYEMLAGEPPFSGPTVQAVVARLLSENPRSITAQRKAVSPGIESAVLRALEKLPADRFASAAEFAAALVTPVLTTAHTGDNTAPAVAQRRSRAAMLLLAGALPLAAALGWWIGRSRADNADLGRLAMDVDMGAPIRSRADLSLSNDGQFVSTVTLDSSGSRVIRVRAFAYDTSRVVAGSEGAHNTFFSPDNQALVYVSENSALRRVAVAGGPSTVLTVGVNRSLVHWGADGWIYFTHNSGGIGRVRATGGAVENLTVLDSTRHEFSHWDAQLLPGGKHVLFFSYTFPADSSRVEVFDLKTRTRIPLVSNAGNPRYVDGGYLTFVRDGSVLVVRFDPTTLRVTGTPAAVLTDVAWDQSGGIAAYAVSNNGTLAYRRSADVYVSQVVKEIRRDGTDGAVLTPPAMWAEPRIAPDDRTVAFTRGGRVMQIWLYDRTRHVLSQLTRAASVSFSPNWTPDGRSLVHVAETPVYDIVRTSVDGSSVDTLLKDKIDKIPTSVSPDGRTFAYTRAEGRDDIFLRTGNDAPRTVGPNADARGGAVISPDGKWIAYTEQAPGRRAEVYVQSYAGTGRRQVSSDGGDQPRWTKGGRELIHRRGDAVIASPINPATGEPGQSVELFRRPTAGQLNGERSTGYDVSADGSRFYLVVPQQQGRSTNVAIVVNWRADLERALSR
jgi:serine/threonine-protein kinase